MRRILTMAVLSAAFGLTGTSASAAITRLDCPLSQARTEITSPLPSGWWQTPQVGKLEETKIGSVGGDPTLMCGYWAYGHRVYVMHKAPAGMTCQADATGFTCKSPAVSVAPVTHSTGPIELKQTWVMDLDNGTVGGSGGGGDVWFQAKTATERFLTPRNGARIAVVGNRSVNLAGCQRASYTSGSINIPPVGTYVCVVTNEGRYSQFRINDGPGPSPGVLKIGYTTWKK